jgi:hypothetical protein
VRWGSRYLADLEHRLLGLKQEVARVDDVPRFPQRLLRFARQVQTALRHQLRSWARGTQTTTQRSAQARVISRQQGKKEKPSAYRNV